MYRRLRTVVEEEGGFAMFPMSPADSQTEAEHVKPGAFVSMLGVPIASASRSYGHLCVINRIGLGAFTDEDLGIARAIAAQVAVAHENATRRHELEAEIARRSAMEKEVRRLNRELEARVRERTAELEGANRELETFSYSVAHDLRSPLRLIDAQVQMLGSGGMGKLPRPVVVQLEQIRRGAEHMSALIDGLLALSRVRHIEMNRRRAPLNDLVLRAIEILAADIGDRSIEWKIGSLPTVECDEDLMLQVFVNLISNAVKYSRPRSPAIIEVGFEGGAEPNVYIRDNGVGFDMRYASKLFGLFQRLHRQDEFEGTGIGLATVSRIIERHGGRVWAGSTLGEGAVFRFTLPGMGAG
jgi:light-regulated signal transduction histidine kinase (bacteriophytochrome)